MTVARSRLVDLDVTPWYHCISECVRGAFLFDSSRDQRRKFLERRLIDLAEIFSIGVCGYCVMDNHMHLLLYLDGKACRRWSKTEVLRRWARLHPPRGPNRKPLKCIKQWLKEKLSDHKYVNERRRRLANLGWFMKSLKEPIAKMANRQDGCRGHFWAARYKSIAVLDPDALLATCAYIDLNPLAAGVVEVPEEAVFTSLYQRLHHIRNRDELEHLTNLRDMDSSDIGAARRLEQDLWLCPIEDNGVCRGPRHGLYEGFTIVHYLRLIDATSRRFRVGKQSADESLPPLLDRLQTGPQHWLTMMDCLSSRRETWGVAFSSSKVRLQEAAAARGCHHVANCNGCPTA